MAPSKQRPAKQRPAKQQRKPSPPPLQPSSRVNEAIGAAPPLPRQSVITARDSECDGDPDEVCRMGVVEGLTARSDLNGKLGRAVRWVAKKNRWAVIMDGGEKVLVKDENIDFQAQAAIDAEHIIQAQLAPPNAAEAVIGVPVPLPEDAVAMAKQQAAAAALADAPTQLQPVLPPIFQLLQCFCLPLGGAVDDPRDAPAAPNSSTAAAAVAVAAAAP